MRVKLIELHLRNFKGIENFSLKTKGESLKIYGDNATGKTTIFDAFTWLLFGKDSSDRTDFEIKGLDQAGKVKQHGMNHEVEGIFEVDGRLLTLKRVFYEKWTKKRGSRSKELTGHSTEYYVDGVPVKKKEYEEKIRSLCSEDLFKLLTNPRYFNEKLDWKKRREMLFEMAGDVSDEEVAKGHEDLETFLQKLNGRNIEDHLKIVKAKQKEINDELDKIPIRIDELALNMPESDWDKETLEQEIQRLNGKIAEKQEVIQNIRSGSEVANLKKRLTEIDLKLAVIQADHGREEMGKKYSIQARIQELESNIKLFETKIFLNKEQIEDKRKRLEKLEQELSELRTAYKETKRLKFEYAGETVCPTCGQALPEEKVEEARAKALEHFNREKSEKLKELVAKGKAKAAETNSVREWIDRLEKENEKYQKEIEKQRDEVQDLLKQLENLETSVTENQDFIAAMEEKKKIEQKLAEIQSESDNAVKEIQSEIASLEEEKNKYQEELHKIQLAGQYKARIDELERKEKELSAEYEALERELYLAEKFMRRKAKLLEEKINSMFGIAKFKLFEDQINGGLKEVCETLYEGVPYDKGLNNAAQINVGLDIIRTLSKKYNTYLPIFVDNAEAVTKLIPIETQTIQLIVSEDHKKLEVKTA